ncbi:hypothetical protein [Indioceanicola profundi]|uniref:hypothetical protein n=1 Tax=Indioceanicola profundi TaxID=2220096 RepID=UPI0019697812|nr:hypothetical protein [Indioceanicola profundi]
MRTPLIALAAALALSACSSRQAEQAQYAQQALVGMPTETLLSCAGVPNRREQAGASEFFTYQNITGGGRSGSSVGVGLGGIGGNIGGGLSLGIPLGGGSGPSGCVATFTLREGRVAQLVYREDADDAAACYSIVENCLALAPQGQ